MKWNFVFFSFLVNFIRDGDGADIWRLYIDRYYMKDILYPHVGKFVGSNGKVLSIGYEPYNNIDRTLARIEPENWYINDILQQSIPTTYGQFILGNLPKVAETKKHFFRAIVDYGVLGFTPAKWPEGAVEAHIKSYGELLEPNGRVFLKWDMNWPKDNPEMWKKTLPLLQAHLIPYMGYLQGDQRCPSSFKKMLISSFHEVEWESQAIISFNWTGVKTACDGYIHSEWKVRK